MVSDVSMRVNSIDRSHEMPFVWDVKFLMKFASYLMDNL